MYFQLSPDLFYRIKLQIRFYQKLRNTDLFSFTNKLDRKRQLHRHSRHRRSRFDIKNTILKIGLAIVIKLKESCRGKLKDTPERE